MNIKFSFSGYYGKRERKIIWINRKNKKRVVRHLGVNDDLKWQLTELPNKSRFLLFGQVVHFDLLWIVYSILLYRLYDLTTDSFINYLLFSLNNVILFTSPLENFSASYIRISVLGFLFEEVMREN
ncbi:MAG: hypothetical protein ACTSR2_03930 [Candidatus Hodarchaeales archaeon]